MVKPELFKFSRKVFGNGNPILLLGFNGWIKEKVLTKHHLFYPTPILFANVGKSS